jgi:hypothetical protein
MILGSWITRKQSVSVANPYPVNPYAAHPHLATALFFGQFIAGAWTSGAVPEVAAVQAFAMLFHR